jgi:hypothetical protein
MSHNFVKQHDGSKVCSCCGDERGKDEEEKPFVYSHGLTSEEAAKRL